MNIGKFLMAGAVALGSLYGVAHAAGDPVRLALIEPLSGPVAGVGRDVLEQYEWMVDRINKRGGVLGGRHIEIVPMDNAMNAEKTTQQLKRAIDEGIGFVTQGVGSNHALNIIEYLRKHNKRYPDNAVVYFNNAAVTTAFTNELCSFWHFRFDANVDQKVAALTTAMGKDSSVKKVYLVNQNYAFGKSFQSAAHNLLKERAPNAEIVGDELIVPFGKVQDFTPYIAKIKESGADTVLTGNWGPDLVRLVVAAAAAGLDTQFFTIYAGIPSSISAIGPENYTKLTIRQVNEFHENEASNPDELNQIAREFREERGKSWYADRYRWAIEMFAQALDRAGTDDPVKVALALEEMSYPGPLGDVVMRKSDHQIQLPMVISTVVDAEGDNTVPFIYDNNDFGVAFKTDYLIPREDLELPTSCEMDRPE